MPVSRSPHKTIKLYEFIKNVHHGADVLEIRDMIELRQLCKTYQLNSRTFHALKSINLTIHRGEIFGIFGESGAGKSTLIRSINLLERPTSGQVFVDQIDLTALTKNQLREQRRHIGMIFQHFNLLQSRTAF